MTTKFIERSVPFDISDDNRDRTIARLQGWLPGLVGLALRIKQAHWNLRGARFKSIHEQLDEILDDVRAGVDDIAERIVTIGGAADGLPSTVAAYDGFGTFAAGPLSVEQAIDTIADDLEVTVKHGRSVIEALGDLDPISEDLAIGVVAAFEKHHWMLTSQREATSS